MVPSSPPSAPVRAAVPPRGRRPDAVVAELAAEVARHPHGRVPADLRRRHIVAVATQLFAERGYRATAMDDVATRAGVSKPIVYGLVGDKHQLFRACARGVTDELSGRIAAAVRAETDPAERFRAGARAFFAFVAEVGPLWDHLVSGESGPIGAEVASARQRQAALVAALLAEQAAADGRTAGPPEVLEAVAQATNGALEALARWWRDHPDRDVDELADLATAFLLPGLLGLAERTPPM